MFIIWTILQFSQNPTDISYLNSFSSPLFIFSSCSFVRNAFATGISPKEMNFFRLFVLQILQFLGICSIIENYEICLNRLWRCVIHPVLANFINNLPLRKIWISIFLQ